MKKLVIPILILLMVSIPVAIAGDDEDEEERIGFGIMEREREHQDDEELAISSDTGNMILYSTIAAIVASVGYTGFKIYRTKSKVPKP